MSSERSFLGKDGWAGLFVLIFSSVLFLLTIGLPDMPLVPVGPGFYPRIVLGLTAFLGLWLLIADYRLQQRHDAQARLSTVRWISILSPYKAVVMHFALFAVYIAAMAPFGFRLSSFAYVAASSCLLDPPKSAKAWLRVLVLASVAAFVTFFIFERYLAVLLPRGRWTSF